MEKYHLTKECGYLGTGTDLSSHKFHAFKKNDNIHIIYNLNSQTQYIVIKRLKDIQNNIEEYLWTPFINFSLNN